MSRSGMVNRFSIVPQTNISRSTFKAPFRHITTFDCDVLVPFYVDEVLPGDTFKVKTNIFARTASLKKPIMDNVKMDTFYFFVPNRLLWDNWQAFMGEQEDPMSPVEYEVPHYHAPQNGFRTRQLEDYFGVPVGINGNEINSLHSRAYYRIWNEWFRDENMCEPEFMCTGDTDVDDADQPVSYRLKSRGKRHDYFTSCLPWPQKGPGVEIPIGDSAPVFGTGKTLGLTGLENSQSSLFGLTAYSEIATYAEKDAFGKNAGTIQIMDAGPDSLSSLGVPTKGQLNFLGKPHSSTGLVADLSEATAYNVNTLRTAMQLQIMLEKDARGGTRYTEIIRSHFQVISPDQRLQRPEYLGGSNSTLGVYPVYQTSSSVAGSPMANLSASAQIKNESYFSKSFTEHGVVIGLMNVQADLTYQQGTRRMWNRKTKHDFAWPSLAHIGEQAVLNKEIYTQGPSIINTSTGVAYDEEVFGYQERYAEYRYGHCMITGDMRSHVTTPESSGSLDIWHLSQDFEELPALNEIFMTSSTPMDRILAIPGTVEAPQPDFIADIYVDAIYTRPLPVFGIPGLMDHF